MPSRGAKLQLKFRVRPLVRMPVSVMFGKLREFVDTGIAPGDIEVAYMEYGHARGGRFIPGQRIQPREHEELRKFWNVLMAMSPEDFRHESKSGKYRPNPESEIRIGEPD